MNILIKGLILLPLVVGSESQLTYAGKEESFVDVAIEENKQFCRKESAAYIKCYDARSSAAQGIAIRSFEILPLAGDYKNKVVGKISTKYKFHTQLVEIGNIDIEQQYRRKGYAEAALRTVLGVYRSEKNKHLQFTQFLLTVSQDNLAAKKLYEKVGFQLNANQPNIHHHYMSLKR